MHYRKDTTFSYVPGETGTETGFLFFGSFVSGTLGGCDGTTPGPVNGGRIELLGGYTVGVLGDKDGATPLIVWGSGGDTSGGSTGGGCKTDPKLSNESWMKK